MQAHDEFCRYYHGAQAGDATAKFPDASITGLNAYQECHLKDQLSNQGYAYFKKYAEAFVFDSSTVGALIDAELRDKDLDQESAAGRSSTVGLGPTPSSSVYTDDYLLKFEIRWLSAQSKWQSFQRLRCLSLAAQLPADPVSAREIITMMQEQIDLESRIASAGDTNQFAKSEGLSSSRPKRKGLHINPNVMQWAHACRAGEERSLRASLSKWCFPHRETAEGAGAEGTSTSATQTQEAFDNEIGDRPGSQEALPLHSPPDLEVAEVAAVEGTSTSATQTQEAFDDEIADRPGLLEAPPLHSSPDLEMAEVAAVEGTSTGTQTQEAFDNELADRSGLHEEAAVEGILTSETQTQEAFDNGLADRSGLEEEAAAEGILTSGTQTQEAFDNEIVDRPGLQEGLRRRIRPLQAAQPEGSHHPGVNDLYAPSRDAFELSRQQLESDHQKAQRQRLVWMSGKRDRNRVTAVVTRCLPPQITDLFVDECNAYVRIYFAEHFASEPYPYLLDGYLKQRESLNVDQQTLKERIDPTFIGFLETTAILAWSSSSHVLWSIRWYKAGGLLGQLLYMCGGVLLATFFRFGYSRDSPAFLFTYVLGGICGVIWLVDWPRRRKASPTAPLPEGTQIADLPADLTPEDVFHHVFDPILDDDVIGNWWRDVEPGLPKQAFHNSVDAMQHKEWYERYVRYMRCLAAGVVIECNRLTRLGTSTLPELRREAAASSDEAKD
ncbi:hypothetical protein IE81DRAFT_350657 [Ceraceosorus guamensis]|uniref:Uncharacterized protein n=1 Tax=Ceraceosorus guamensis TaxID=1522189 RepID=A0A316VMW7_9BASI|nr:hypothetical protein IE81DRAFT_350657 [Ceraceosorus guamensis]PWN38906.1 hypothetical protein IE81DRAFT_350657 [Ceraceosorus guamensis]